MLIQIPNAIKCVDFIQKLIASYVLNSELCVANTKSLTLKVLTEMILKLTTNNWL